MNDMVYYAKEKCELKDIKKITEEAGYRSFYNLDNELVTHFDETDDAINICIWSVDNEPIEEYAVMKILNNYSCKPQTIFVIEFREPVLFKMIALLKLILGNYQGCIYSDVISNKLFTLSDLDEVIQYYITSDYEE